jgi:hypothetical protein
MSGGALRLGAPPVTVRDVEVETEVDCWDMLLDEVCTLLVKVLPSAAVTLDTS